MSQRYFATDRLAVDGKLLRAYRIQCNVCKKVEKVHVNTLQSNGGGVDDVQNARQTQRKFERLGWFIGKRDRNDVCPDCRTDRPISTVIELPQPDADPILDRNDLLSSTACDSVPLPEPLAPTIHSPPPAKAKSNGTLRQITREERRIIYSKIEEVYEGETTGYREGWSDDHVARDLNVPRDWVATVRQENFGEWADNPTLRNLIDETRQAIEESKAVSARVQSAFSTLESSFAAMKGLLSESQRAAQRVLNIEQRLNDVKRKSGG